MKELWYGELCHPEAWRRVTVTLMLPKEWPLFEGHWWSSVFIDNACFQFLKTITIDGFPLFMGWSHLTLKPFYNLASFSFPAHLKPFPRTHPNNKLLGVTPSFLDALCPFTLPNLSYCFSSLFEMLLSFFNLRRVTFMIAFCAKIYLASVPGSWHGAPQALGISWGLGVSLNWVKLWDTQLVSKENARIAWWCWKTFQTLIHFFFS